MVGRAGMWERAGNPSEPDGVTALALVRLKTLAAPQHGLDDINVFTPRSSTPATSIVHSDEQRGTGLDRPAFATERLRAPQPRPTPPDAAEATTGAPGPDGVGVRSDPALRHCGRRVGEALEGRRARRARCAKAAHAMLSGAQP